MRQEISLYLDLKEGEKVDLETAARAALAFDALLKEVAFSLDPFSTVKIELESGTEGSLSLNSVISTVTGSLTKRRLIGIALGAAGWLAMEAGSWTVDKVLDLLVEQPAVSESMTDEEIKEIANEVVRLLNNRMAEPQAKKLFQELQRDDSIKGVGITTEKDKKPRHIVPRSEFQQRGRVLSEVESAGVRTETTVQSVTLVSPVLFKSKRKWKFRQGKLEFGAPVLDEAFLDRLLSGREPVPMSDGIIMKVKMTVKEEKIAGLWQVVGRTIDEVIEVTPPSVQYGLFLPSKE